MLRNELVELDDAGVALLLRTLELNVELSLTLCEAAFIRGLNAQWRGKDKETDVLSFPMDHEDGSSRRRRRRSRRRRRTTITRRRRRRK